MQDLLKQHHIGHTSLEGLDGFDLFLIVTRQQRQALVNLPPDQSKLGFHHPILRLLLMQVCSKFWPEIHPHIVKETTKLKREIRLVHVRKLLLIGNISKIGRENFKDAMSNTHHEICAIVKPMVLLKSSMTTGFNSQMWLLANRILQHQHFIVLLKRIAE